MAAQSLTDRVAALEAEVASLKKQLADASKPKDWIDVIYGSFAGDAAHEEAMRLGRKWRASFRPKARKKKAKNANSRHRSSHAAGKAR
jgi:hypothetical protein